MEKKLVLEELYRMRELMGMKVLSETKNILVRNLLMEGGKTVDEIIGLGPKSVDNLTKNGVDFANDLTKLSDEFASRGIKTFDDLTQAVAIKQGLDITNVTDDMIESFIKNDEDLYNSILKKASEAAADQVDQLIKNANLTTIFSNNIDQLDTYKTFISTAPTARNVDTLITGIDGSIDEVETLIDDIQNGKVAGVNTVPDELQDLYEQLLAKKTDLDGYKNKPTSSTPSPDPNKPKTDDELELERLRKQKELENSKQEVVNKVKTYIKSDADWNKLGWWPNWLGNKNKQQVLTYIDELIGKYDYESMRQLAIKELDRVKTKREIAKLTKTKQGMWIEKFLRDNPKTVSMTKKIGIVGGVLAAIYYGFLADFIKGAYENNKDVVLGTEIDDCFKTVTGWSEMDDDAKTKFAGLGYGCQNRNKDEAPNDFITSVKYEKADPSRGTAEKFIITIGGQVRTVLASGSGNNNNNNNTSQTYTNDPTGYKKYVEDKGGTYGTSGNYVMEDGTPFYKDGSGNWQAGSYNGTTFVTN